MILINVALFNTLFFIFLYNVTNPITANTEIRALMDIKASLDPENKMLKSWKIDGDPCSGSFEGLACNDIRKVVNISLQGRGLAGKLSPAIGDLNNLIGIYLHFNKIYGEIPREIARLNRLHDLYLNVNALSGSIPSEFTHMSSLQVLDLCCNQLRSAIPTQLGSLNKLNVLSLQYNQLTGNIPSSLGNLAMLTRLDLSYNHLSGPIPTALLNIQLLQFLDVRNNSLSGVVPTELKRLKEGFSYGNNKDLCGTEFLNLRSCTAFDIGSVAIDNTPQPIGMNWKNNTATNNEHRTRNFDTSCGSHSACSNPKRLPRVVVVVGVVAISSTLAAAVVLIFFRYRRQKQKVGTMLETSECTLSPGQTNDSHNKSASPLMSLAHSTGWDPLADGLDSGEFSHVVQSFRLNLEDVESATGYFSEANMLGKGKFSSVYKGVLRDGSVVAIKSINVNSCKSEEAEFVKGIELLTTLRHENVVNLRGFCCSRGRGECFLIYDFAVNGNLLKYLDVGDGSGCVLEWSTRVKIITGIAKGLHYLHEENESKPSLVHQNISAEKVLLDEEFNPLISNSGIRKILADDIIFSALKVSAAMGYLAPEYITTGRFTNKSDVYAFGVILLHIISGKQLPTIAIRSAAESFKLEDFIDRNLDGKFSTSEAAMMVKLGVSCTDELPDRRPYMEVVLEELSRQCSGF